MPLIRSALAYSFLGANTVAIIQFASTLVIARLLTPEELGIYSVAAVFIGLAAILRDFGIANYLIQLDELNDKVLRGAFGLAIVTAVTMGFAILWFARDIAEFYRDPRVQDVLTVLAINFFITPLGSITLAVARRDMRFRAIAAINVVSACLSAGLSIALIYFGMGPVGLAWGAVAATTTTFLMSLQLRTKDMPYLPSLKGSLEIVSFGSLSAGANMLGLLNVSASDMILGRMLNMEAVGLFNRAVSLTLFINRVLSSALSPVLLPWLSQLKRDKQHPRIAYRKVVELTTGITWPIFAAIAAFSDEVILVLFGQQWWKSAELVPFFCASAGLGSAYAVCHPLYLAAGKPSAGFFAQAVNLPIKIGAIILLVPMGMYAVAEAWPWLALIGGLTHQLLMKRVADIGLADTLAGVTKSIGLTVAALAASLATQSLMSNGASEFLVLAVGMVTVGIIVLGTAFLIQHPLSIEVKSLVLKFRNNAS